jgi:pimeloyl-ACP methyl ester carboxylesterase
VINDAPVAHRLGAVNGSGPLLALVHGLEDRWESWAPLVQCLDRSWRLLAFDMPWRTGNSYRWRQVGTPGAWLARALERVNEPLDVIVGHSFGANAVLELLATADPPPSHCAVLLSPFYRPQDLPITWEVFEQSRRSFDRIVGQGLRARLGDRNAAVTEEILQIMAVKSGTDRIGPLGFMALFEQFAASADLALGAVTVPTLILSSTSDPSLAHGRAEALARQMPCATVVLSDDLAHFCHVQDAASVVGALKAFLQEVRTST